MKKFNFEITFICANSNEQKIIIKEYKALDYTQAKKGIKAYCLHNKTYKKVIALHTLKAGIKSRNLISM